MTTAIVNIDWFNNSVTIEVGGHMYTTDFGKAYTLRGLRERASRYFTEMTDDKLVHFTEIRNDAVTVYEATITPAW